MFLVSLIAGNPLNHSRGFRLRRLFNWLPLGLTYAFLYMGRYNLTVSKNALGTLMPKEDFGIIFAAGTVTYAFSCLFNGPLTDKIGGKKAIIIGAVGSALMNALMGLLTYFVLVKGMFAGNILFLFSLFYSINMYFQSYGAIAIVKVNANWFHVRERGSFGGIFGALIAMGIYFAFDWGAFIVEATKANITDELGFFQSMLRIALISDDHPAVDQTWWVFLIPCLILLIFVVLDILLLKDRPDQAGFKAFDAQDASSGEDETPIPLFDLLKRILTNRVILVIGAIQFCSGVLRNGIMHWYPIYLNEMGVPKDFLFKQHWGIILALAGIFGGVLAGLISDKIFGSRRGPVAALLYAVMGISILMMVFSLKDYFMLGVIVSVLSVAVIGIHGILAGTATMDFGGRKAAGTAVGIIDGFVYLGTGLQSISLGYITTTNWNYWPIFLMPFSLLGFFLALKIWQALPQPAKRPVSCAKAEA
ncbi:MAG: MFS transporter [Oligoflexales bacterium]|nr:MFS transporter [Oligoflexales bacterium]